MLETPLGLGATLQQAVLALLVVGLFITLVLAWYHGEKGRQRVSGPELLMVAALLVVAGGGLVILGRDSGIADLSDQPAAEEVEDLASALRRRPETTTLHPIVRENLETYLALANEADPVPGSVRPGGRDRTARLPEGAAPIPRTSPYRTYAQRLGRMVSRSSASRVESFIPLRSVRAPEDPHPVAVARDVKEGQS